MRGIPNIADYRRLPVGATVGLGHVFTSIVVLILTLLASAASAQAPQPGLANDFEIDGNLYSNNPGGIIGLGNDWLDGPAGPGTGVLFSNGDPKNPSATLHIIDGVKSADQDVFEGGWKVNDDPNVYTWKAGSAPQKDDIQHGLIHMTTDGSDNLWFSVAGDRRSTNGDSYIDFEFLQHTLVKNADGTFTSAGPDGGRTLGDLLLTIRLEQGGSQAQFFAQEWVSDGQGGYEYVAVPFPAGAAFVAANIDSSVTITYDAFGNMIYDINQFGEAAVNMNAVFHDFGQCFAIATIFVRTKSSNSTTATLKDFVEPYQINTCVDKTPPTLECPLDITVDCTESVDPGDVGEPIVTDECAASPIVTYNDSIVPGACPSEYTIYRRWRAEDNCWNVATCTQVIHVVDDTPPVVVGSPGPMTLECGDQVPPPDTGGIVATDDCGVPTVTYMGDVTSGTDCNQTITRTWQVDDGCGNVATVTQLITITDTTAPTVSCASNAEFQCIDDVPVPDIGTVTASDACSSVTVTHVGDVPDNNSCPLTITRTYRAVDACGNSAECTQILVVNDTTPPTITGPPDVTLSCSEEMTAADISQVSATDNCGNVTVTWVGDQSDGNSCPQVVLRTYRATDDCGNSADYVQRCEINDTTPPTISGPPDVVLSCREEITPPDIGLITADDNCGDVTVTFVSDVSDGNNCPEVILRTYRATDECGNSTDYVQRCEISDTTPPTLSGPANMTVECAADIPPADIGVITASDGCGQVTVSYVGDESDGNSCPEVVARTYRVTDACGNTTDFVQLFLVEDKTPPTVIGPANMTLECGNGVPAADIDLITAADNCGNIVVTHVGDESDGNTCPQVIRRTYRISDQCGNTTHYVQLITIEDTTPPVAKGPADMTLECGYDVPAPNVGLIFASDACGDVKVTHVGDQADGGTCPKVITRTYRITDVCGNTVDHVQLITIEDTTAPVVQGPGNLEVECADEVPGADIQVITASDECGQVVVTHVGDQPDGATCPQTITRTYRATDVCGNATDYAQVITIFDHTKPEVTPPPDLTVECSAGIPDPNPGAISASDNCGEVTVEHVRDVSDTETCPETITRTYRVTDECGNATEVTQKITVNDDTPPKVSQEPDTMQVECGDDVPEPAPDAITASDNCGEVRVVHLSDVSEGEGCQEAITRTYRVLDQCDNYVDVAQMIYVEDTTPPVLSDCGEDQTLSCPTALSFTPPTATDNCDPDPEVVLEVEHIEYGQWQYSITRSWSATDNCGNVSLTCEQTITAHCERDALCTFTQGFWGNYGGKFNDQTTLELIDAALATDPLIVGKPGRSLTFERPAGHCIIERLPAGTTPMTLPEGLGDVNMNEKTCVTKPGIPLDSEGKFENVLLGQTIALTLNMRLDEWLRYFPLEESFCTVDVLPGGDGLYGTEDDIPNPNGTPIEFSIPSSVLKALDNIGEPRIVAGLLELANIALAGMDTGGATIPDVNNAVDVINNAFNRCRILVDCTTTTAGRNNKDWGSDPFGASMGEPALGVDLPTHFDLDQNYPNPFNPFTTIRFAIPVAANWSIGIYNVAGKLVRRYEGTTGGPEYVSVQWDAKDMYGQPTASGVYFYRAKAGDFKKVRRMILLR